MSKFNPIGLDLDWYAFDKVGRCAHFSSGGSDMVPKKIIENLDVYKKINAYVLSLPIISEAKLLVDPTGDMQSWLERAKRGFLCFDFNMNDSGPYNLICIPLNDKVTIAISKEIAELMYKFNNVDFSKCSQINYSDIGDH